jgi:hypothetical protein
MRTINNLMQANLKVDLPTELQQALIDTSDKYIAAQKEQLFEGEDSDGKDIEPFYAESTIARKKKKGQPTDRVTLLDTGKFQEAIFQDVFSDRVITSSSDSKTKKLEEKYGAKIFGLDRDRKSQHLELVADKLKENITKELNIR